MTRLLLRDHNNHLSIRMPHITFFIKITRLPAQKQLQESKIPKFFTMIKTHGRVSVGKKDTQPHKYVIYVTGQVVNFPPITQKLLGRFLLIHILVPSPCHNIPNLKEIAPAVPEIWVPETRQIFFVFFFFAPND